MWVLLLCACGDVQTTDLVLAGDGSAAATLPADASLPQGAVPARLGRDWLSVSREGGRQPLLGSYERHGDELVFTPSRALQPGESYVAELRIDGELARTDTLVLPALQPDAPPEVVAVYPSGDQLPANHLKFYVHFSEPMQSTRELYQHVRLVDVDTGEPLAMAWHEYPLWNADRTVATLLVHPGRQKRDIGFGDGLGPVLRPDGHYRLEIDDLVAADGQVLAGGHVKEFRTYDADRTKPDPRGWTLEPPDSGTTGALELLLDEPLERELLLLSFRVFAGEGEVGGTFETAEDERILRFVPDAAWQPGAYRLVAVERVEDLAGNSPERLFDAHASDPAVPVDLRWDFLLEEPG